VASAQATCVTSALTAGTHSITAVYSGDANNGGSTSNTVSQQVNSGTGAVTTTAVISSLNPSNFGQSVTFAAFISGGNAPTGTLNFKDGANSIVNCATQTVAPIKGGYGATCVTSALSSGSHSITAVYSGDANNQGSTSPPITQTVSGGGGAVPTTTTVVSSQTYATAGTPVTFTATITGNGPTGAVNFKDGANSIGGCNAQPVAAGQAQCTTSSLALGKHSITAAYGGDPNNLPSTSAAIGQVIQ
jgi:ABC-type molybdate transport system substrate-binding protein